MKNKAIEKIYVKAEWPKLKNLRNKLKAGKITYEQFHQAKRDAKKIDIESPTPLPQTIPVVAPEVAAVSTSSKNPWFKHWFGHDKQQ